MRTKGGKAGQVDKDKEKKGRKRRKIKFSRHLFSSEFELRSCFGVADIGWVDF